MSKTRGVRLIRPCGLDKWCGADPRSRSGPQIGPVGADMGIVQCKSQSSIAYIAYESHAETWGSTVGQVIGLCGTRSLTSLLSNVAL